MGHYAIVALWGENNFYLDKIIFSADNETMTLNFAIGSKWFIQSSY